MIAVSFAVAKALTVAYDRAFPREACGFLLGVSENRGGRIRRELVATAVVLARGAASHGEFAIPDSELRRITAWGEDRRLHIVALFHSHPSGDRRLSAADRAALRHSEWPWVVVTRSGGGDAAGVLTGYQSGHGARTVVRVGS